ncbi:MAG: GDSL-type esterase/lipase family protein [Nitrospirota bacterium]|nr:GDSL-type esterase/lipase family protein [Nitrospirota bacterium]
MRREWILTLVSVGLTLVVALGLIRWLAPGLLGMSTPVDLQVVQLDDQLPPFYESMLGPDVLSPDTPPDRQDPLVGMRHQAMVPPNYQDNAPFDLLGFRNHAVPTVADVVTIGDSQTVGLNATLEYTWPGVMARLLRPQGANVYNMSKGGWGAVQYLYMAEKALTFRPRVLVVAFYSGNDPLEAVRLAYGYEPWASLRGHATEPDRPPSAWPPAPEDLWRARFSDGGATVFTAKTRLMSNDRDYPATAEGYRIMAEAGRRIAEVGRKAKVPVVFTIIPTKEFVYSGRVRGEGLEAPEAYSRLVSHEGENIRELVAALQDLKGATYVDVIDPLRQVLATGVALYLPNSDGHPAPAGYEVIARVLTPVVHRMIPAPPASGVYRVVVPEGWRSAPVVHVAGRGVSWFWNMNTVMANGWPSDLSTMPVVTLRDLAVFTPQGMISGADPARFGPPADN